MALNVSLSANARHPKDYYLSHPLRIDALCLSFTYSAVVTCDGQGDYRRHYIEKRRLRGHRIWVLHDAGNVHGDSR